jgi:hypothetical protein
MDLNLTHCQVQNSWIRQSIGRFGSVFIKKSNQTGFFFKNQNRLKPIGFGLVILEQKPVQTGFSGLARFFRFGFGSVFSVSNL